MFNGKLMKNKAIYHLPGLFEFYELYKRFLPLFYEHEEYFYDWCSIGSIYGAPSSCIWGGGRIEEAECSATEALSLVQKYGISARLTFSNSLLRKEHLEDKNCNKLCDLFSGNNEIKNGIIIHSDLLLSFLKSHYPNFYYVSSTTKVITNFEGLVDEINNEDFTYVVPDFRLNKQYDKLNELTKEQKNKLEFLCNECCDFLCNDRKKCYEEVSYKLLGEEGNGHFCKSPNKDIGYRFSEAMKNPGFISVTDVLDKYLPMGFTNFKIEGRSLGSALLLEFLLYYMTKPEYQINVREQIYLDNSLDLF